MLLISNILGIVAIVISGLSMVFKKKATIMLFSMIYNILTLTSYLLLGKYLGSILVGVLTLKSLVYYLFALKKLKPNTFVLILFEVSILCLSIVLWDTWVDIFMLTNSIINTYFTWQDNVIYLKISVVVCACLLILYDVLVGAYVYVLSEVIYGGTALVSLIIMIKQRKKTEEIENAESSNFKEC